MPKGTAGGPKERHQPTDANRERVAALSGVGATEEEIAHDLGIARNTLRKHYKMFLEYGRTRANLKVKDTLFQMAIGRAAQYDRNGNQLRAEQAPDFRAVKFWLERRCDWTERQQIEVSGRDGEPLPAPVAPEVRFVVYEGGRERTVAR